MKFIAVFSTMICLIVAFIYGLMFMFAVDYSLIDIYNMLTGSQILAIGSAIAAFSYAIVLAVEEINDN